MTSIIMLIRWGPSAIKVRRSLIKGRPCRRPVSHVRQRAAPIAAIASASPNYDPDSRRSHGRCGLNLGPVSLFLTGLELARLELADCRIASGTIK
jgi:hypothetical protein